jgi:hypothetical protein
MCPPSTSQQFRTLRRRRKEEELATGMNDDLDTQHERALAPGARLPEDRSDDPGEPLRVYAGAAGHPFCTFAG